MPCSRATTAVSRIPCAWQSDAAAAPASSIWTEPSLSRVRNADRLARGEENGAPPLAARTRSATSSRACPYRRDSFPARSELPLFSSLLLDVARSPSCCVSTGAPPGLARARRIISANAESEPRPELAAIARFALRVEDCLACTAGALARHSNKACSTCSSVLAGVPRRRAAQAGSPIC